MYKIVFSRQSLKDLEKLKRAGYGKKIKELTDIAERK